MAGSSFIDSFLPALAGGAAPLPKTLLDYQRELAQIGGLEAQAEMQRAHADRYKAMGANMGSQSAIQYLMSLPPDQQQQIFQNPYMMMALTKMDPRLSEAKTETEQRRGESYNALTNQRVAGADLNYDRGATERAKTADITALTQPKVDATTALGDVRRNQAEQTAELTAGKKSRLQAQADASRALAGFRTAQEKDVTAQTPGKVKKLGAEVGAIASLEDLRKARANFERERAKAGPAGASGGSAMTRRTAAAFQAVEAEVNGGEPAGKLNHDLVNRYLHGVEKPTVTETIKKITPGRETTRQEKLTGEQATSRTKLNDLAKQAVKKATDSHRGWFGVDKEAARAELSKVMEHATDEEHQALRLAMEEAGL